MLEENIYNLYCLLAKSAGKSGGLVRIMRTKGEFRYLEIRRVLSNSSLLRHKLTKRMLNNPVANLAYKFGKVPKPYDISFCLTGKCNMRCKMCDIGYSNIDTKLLEIDSIRMVRESQPDTLGLKKNKEIIDTASGFNPIIRLIGAGEPMLYPDIMKLLHYIIKDKGLNAIIVTNGTNISKYAKELVQLGVYSVNISLDGPEKIHENIRGLKGSHKMALNALRNLAEARRKAGTLFPQIRVNYTISNHNYLDIVRFVDEIRKEDIDILNFFHLFFKTEKMVEKHNSGHDKQLQTTPSSIYGVDHKAIDIRALNVQISQVKIRYKNLNIFFQPDLNEEQIKEYYSLPEKLLNKKSCIIPWTKLYILPNGDAIPMYMCINYKMGNVLKDGFFEVWYGDRYKKLREIILKENSFPICARCCGLFAE